MSERRAFEVILPNGTVERLISSREISHATFQRVDLLWKACWFTGRMHAERQMVRFMCEMLHRSGLRPDQYETRLAVPSVIPVPEVRYAHARLPGRARAKIAYYPSWGHAAPIAVVAVSSHADGWRAGSWVTTREEQDRECERLGHIHDRVTVVEAERAS